MSLEATRWASSTSPRSKGAARALLLILADMANPKQGHTCWPTDGMLAKRLNCSTRTVWRHIALLVDAGDIAVRSGGGRGKRNVYTFPAISDVANTDRFDSVSTHKTLTDLARNPDISGAETLTDLARNPDISVTPINQPEINLSTSNRETSTAQTDDDDLAAPFRADLADLAQRPLTDGERSTIDDHGATVDGRSRLRVALDRLRARWPEIVRRDNVSGWLASTLRNLAEEGAPAAVVQRDYVREPATIDDLRLEHAIEPGPVPAYVELWDAAIAELRLELPAGTFQAGLLGVEAIDGDDAMVKVKARHTQGREFLQGRLHRRCESVLQRVAGRAMMLVIA